MRNLTNKQITEKIFEIMYNQIGYDGSVLTLYTKLEEFVLDSLDEIEITMDLEKEFRVSIPDSYLEEVGPKLKTIGDIKDSLKHFGVISIEEQRFDKLKNINELS